MGKKKTGSKGSGGVNKSQAIRDALAKNPDASPKQLSADLTAQGIKVSAAFVSMIKFNMKARSKAAKKTRSAGNGGGAFFEFDLLETKKLVDRIGGIEKVQSLLGTLKKLL